MREAERFVSIPELAKMLGISRIAVYKKVRKGEIKAVRVGRSYAIPARHLGGLAGEPLGPGAKRSIDAAVRRTVKEYGEVLKLLGRE